MKPRFYDERKVNEVWIERAALIAEEAATANLDRKSVV